MHRRLIMKYRYIDNGKVRIKLDTITSPHRVDRGVATDEKWGIPFNTYKNVKMCDQGCCVEFGNLTGHTVKRLSLSDRMRRYGIALRIPYNTVEPGYDECAVPEHEWKDISELIFGYNAMHSRNVLEESDVLIEDLSI